jgi:mannose/fructose/N-acetylgalactosamine-specific phosphotransferase system component IIC
MKQLPAIISMVLLVGFLVPYIWKIKESPLLALLVLGVFFAIYDFYVSSKKAEQRAPQHPSYDSEST